LPVPSREIQAQIVAKCDRGLKYFHLITNFFRLAFWKELKKQQQQSNATPKQCNTMERDGIQ